MAGISQDIETTNPVASLKILILGLLSVVAGTLLAAVVLPAWLPSLTTSILGDAPKIYWYLSRGSALVGFALLWLSMVFGLTVTNRLARLWPGGPAAVDLHQYVSLLGLGFAVFHTLILLGDQYMKSSLAQVLIPFTNQNYRPVWVGVGQIAIYVWALVIGSFYIRKKISGKTWRWIHYTSFLAFAAVIVHGFFSGTDSGTVWANGMYWVAGISTLFLLYYRILVTMGDKKKSRAAK